jgi:hypothetical protein
MKVPNAYELPCSQAGCHEAATHVVVQGHALALLFRSMAGTACEKHAREFEQHGGLFLSLPAYVDAVKRERPELLATEGAA